MSEKILSTPSHSKFCIGVWIKLQSFIKIEGRGQLKMCYEYRILFCHIGSKKIMEKSIFFIRMIWFQRVRKMLKCFPQVTKVSSSGYSKLQPQHGVEHIIETKIRAQPALARGHYSGRSVPRLKVSSERWSGRKLSAAAWEVQRRRRCTW